jgi:hypothetical protein
MGSCEHDSEPSVSIKTISCLRHGNRMQKKPIRYILNDIYVKHFNVEEMGEGRETMTGLTNKQN